MSHLLLRIKPDTFVNEIWLCEVEHVVRYYCVLGDFFFFFWYIFAFNRCAN